MRQETKKEGHIPFFMNRMSKEDEIRQKYDNLIRSNEVQANIVIGKLMLVVAGFYYLAGILMICGLTSRQKEIISTLFLFGTAFVLWAVLALGERGDEAKPMHWLKYICISQLMVSVFVINVLVGYKVWLLYAVPIIMTIRYYNKRFTTVVGLVAMALIFCSAYTNAYLSMFTQVIDLNTVSFETPGTLLYDSWLQRSVIYHGFDPETVMKNSIRLSTIPNCLIMTVIVFICNSVIQNAVTMLKRRSEQYEHEIELLRNSLTDGMTGLLNRRAYNEDVEELAEKPMPEDTVYISIDVNGLKNVNDTLGHMAGDEIINGVAACIKAVFNSHGRVYRMGGDEYAAIIHANAETLTVLKEEFEKRIEEWSGTLIQSLSVSAGYVIASDLDCPATLEEAAKLADRRMYDEKARYYADVPYDRRKHG